MRKASVVGWVTVVVVCWVGGRGQDLVRIRTAVERKRVEGTGAEVAPCSLLALGSVRLPVDWSSFLQARRKKHRAEAALARGAVLITGYSSSTSRVRLYHNAPDLTLFSCSSGLGGEGVWMCGWMRFAASRSCHKSSAAQTSRDVSPVTIFGPASDLSLPFTSSVARIANQSLASEVGEERQADFNLMHVCSFKP